MMKMLTSNESLTNFMLSFYRKDNDEDNDVHGDVRDEVHSDAAHNGGCILTN